MNVEPWSEGRMGIVGQPDIEGLKESIALYVGQDRVPARLRVVTDTTDFYRLDYDDVLVLDGREYFIRHYEREGRFGIEEQPKFWVRRAVDLSDGSLKVIKMVFYERFTARCGGLTYECARSPAKEAGILKMVAGHPGFMQGFSARDSAGNNVRVIDYIKGPSYPEYVAGMSKKGHEEYYYTGLPGVLREFITLVEAIGFLHAGGQTHGDIRRDHIIMDRESGLSKWVDFDFSCMHRESLYAYDIAGLGNVLLYLAGGGDVTLQGLEKAGSPVFGQLHSDDMNIIFKNRVANLRKVYPYISEEINYMLMHFSMGAGTYYRTVREMAEDMERALSGMKGGNARKES